MNYDNLTFAQLKEQLRITTDKEEQNIIRSLMLEKYKHHKQKKQKPVLDITNDIIDTHSDAPDATDKMNEKMHTRETFNNVMMDRLDSDVYINNVRGKKSSKVLPPFSAMNDSVYAPFDSLAKSDIKKFRK